MGEIIMFAERRAAPAAVAAAPNPLADLTRSPELALVMALISAMPISTRRAVLTTVASLVTRDPDDEAALLAYHIAAQLSARGGA